MKNETKPVNPKINKKLSKMTDADFVLGKNEVDIRKLSTENKVQIGFRILSNMGAVLSAIHQSLTDVSTLLMYLIKQNGCDDIINALDQFQSSLLDAVKIKDAMKAEQAKANANKVKDA